MHALNQAPPDVLPPLFASLVTARPDSWQGMDVEWMTQARPVPVYLRSFPMRHSRGADEVHLLAARYELTEAVVGGDALGEGHFIEYFVIEQTTGQWSLRRLMQSASVTYSEGDEEADYLPAVNVVEPGTFSLAEPPRWKRSAAVWPTSDGAPMTFLGQVELPDTQLTRRLLTWETTVFLFATSGAALELKVVEHDTTEQSTEEHYRDEETE